MKKLLAVTSGMLLVVFLLATAMAGSNAPAQGNGQNDQQDKAKKKDVSQSRIDTVTKREKSKEHVEKMLKEREKTIAKADEDDRKGKGKKTLP